MTLIIIALAFYNKMYVLLFLFMQNTYLELILWLAFFTLALFFLPIKGSFKLSAEKSNSRFNERNTMFSRNEIATDADLQQDYYKDFPEHDALDKEWLIKPGLLDEKASLYSALSFKAADATFDTIGRLKPFAEGEVNVEKEEISSIQLSSFLEKWSKKLGAVSIGFCEMQDYHFYSVRGRGDVYGKKVDRTYKNGIVFTVEMEEEFLSMGPAGPSIMESAQRYLSSGTIAVQMAEFIRKMGYEARAHIDGNYELIAPLVARDAGLGELGRMGLLITPKLGPRVRLAVITTNAPIIPTVRKPDYSVHHFCNLCKKCATICPSNAIPKTPIAEIDGVQRWKINHEKCYSYWCTVGTDCGRCMSVCPYAHKSNALHNFVRWGIRNNIFFRRLAVVMDDIIYGKKPKPAKVPQWML